MVKLPPSSPSSALCPLLAAFQTGGSSWGLEQGISKGWLDAFLPEGPGADCGFLPRWEAWERGCPRAYRGTALSQGSRGSNGALVHIPGARLSSNAQPLYLICNFSRRHLSWTPSVFILFFQVTWLMLFVFSIALEGPQVWDSAFSYSLSYVLFFKCQRTMLT